MRPRKPKSFRGLSFVLTALLAWCCLLPGRACAADTHTERIIALVTINGRGPFRFMLDTGANQTVLAESVVQRLQLPLDNQALIAVVAVSGTTWVTGAHVDRLDSGALHLVDVQLPVLSGRLFDDLDGILGTDGFKDKKMSADFINGQFTIAQSQRAGAPQRLPVIALQFLSRRMMLVDGYVGRVRTKALIDTGGTHTLGNRALLDALNTGRGEPLVQSSTRVVDATQGLQAATLARVPLIRLGGANIERLAVTFGDFPVFEAWGLQDQPALLIGMDVLGSLAELNIDYRRRELAMLPRAGTLAAH
jgi:predicted aspartyl protease